MRPSAGPGAGVLVRNHQRHARRIRVQCVRAPARQRGGRLARGQPRQQAFRRARLPRSASRVSSAAAATVSTTGPGTAWRPNSMKATASSTGSGPTPSYASRNGEREHPRLGEARPQRQPGRGVPRRPGPCGSRSVRRRQHRVQRVAERPLFIGEQESHQRRPAVHFGTDTRR